MADNEAKARQKMAEGRKKLSGGGGFFSKVFGGGGGGGEAADLFIQGEEDEDMEAEESNANNATEVECSYEGCDFVASNLLEFEQHYAQHSFQCFMCRAAFETAHRLSVHQDEQHNPFFEICVEKRPNDLNFRCLHPTCGLCFSNSRTRDEHARVIHMMQVGAYRRRKLDDIGVSAILNSGMNRISVQSPKGEDAGWTGESQQGLATQREIKKAARRNQIN